MKLPNLPADPHVTGSDGLPTQGYSLFFDSIIRVLRSAVLGSQSLLTVNTIPKITSAGTLTESAISDNGTTVTVTGNTNTTGVYQKAGTAGITQVVVLAKITGGGANGSFTSTGGIVTAYTAPT